MKAYLAIIGKLRWLGFAGFTCFIFKQANLAWFFIFFLLLFFHPLNARSLALGIGTVYAGIAHLGRVPSKDNYTCKGNYILPFIGKWTVANGSVEKAFSHSWYLHSQRFAYDFFIMDNEGQSYSGDVESLGSYYCYGKDVVAPADGVVVQLRNDYKDSRTNGKSTFCDAYDMRGNHIIIKHGDGEYSMIAHLLAGSISVNIGDMVKQGEIIAGCGNSGASTEPHIHFQLQSGKSIFTSVGLPIAFSGLCTQKKENYEVFDNRPCEDKLLMIDSKTYISRGFEVENSNG